MIRSASLLATLVLLAGGCSSPINLQLAEQLPAPARATIPDRFVSIGVLPVEDARPEFSRDNAGTVMGRDVAGTDFTSWIFRHVSQLQGQRFRATGTPATTGWLIRPKLRQFYASSLAVSKNANVVIELSIQSPTGEEFSRMYRGGLTAVNWWNSSAEIEGALGSALRSCLARMTTDLDTLIGNDRPETQVAAADQPAL